MPEATTTVKLTLKNGTIPTVNEGNGKLFAKDGQYYLTIPAGGWAFIKI